MNKKLNTFLTEQNFEIETNGATTYINDFQISISQVGSLYSGMQTIAQVFSHLNDELIPVATSYMKEKKKEFKIASYEVDNVGICMSIAHTNYAKLLEVIQNVTIFLKEHEAKNKDFCPISGEPLDEATKRKLYYNNCIVYLNEESVQILNQEIERAELEYQNAPNNYAKGILGAIVGGAIGAVVWIVVGALLGVISGWIAFLIAFLAGFGYDKMKGKQNNTKIITASIVTLVYVILSMFLIYVIVVMQVMSQEGISGNPVALLFDILEQDPDIRVDFISDLVLGLVFGIIGVVCSIFQMRKSLHHKQTKL